MAKKLPKKPRKPRASASLKSWQKFDERMKLWQHKVNSIKNGEKMKENLIKKYSHV